MFLQCWLGEDESWDRSRGWRAGSELKDKTQKTSQSFTPDNSEFLQFAAVQTNLMKALFQGHRRCFVQGVSFFRELCSLS